jgi:hypothetical protein
LRFRVWSSLDGGLHMLHLPFFTYTHKLRSGSLSGFCDGLSGDEEEEDDDDDDDDDDEGGGGGGGGGATLDAYDDDSGDHHVVIDDEEGDIADKNDKA